MVVRVPDPAINGKAMGTTLPLLALPSDLKNSCPNTISSPMINITILPATAKDCTSSHRRSRNCFPINRKRIINAPDAKVAWVDRICPPIFTLREASTGILPTISITAKRVKVTVNISLITIFPKSNCYNFCKYTCSKRGNRFHQEGLWVSFSVAIFDSTSCCKLPASCMIFITQP